MNCAASFPVFFEKWHGEYPATEEGYAQMTRDVQAVLGRAVPGH